MSDAAAHMERIYRWQRHIYDLTRKPYLLGRDGMIAALGVPDGGKVLEIGCGTGRNLVQAARAFPHGRYYGFDVAPVMVDTARKAVTRARLGGKVSLAQGDATAFDAAAMFGETQFDRIFISYSLSMIPDWRKVLECGLDHLPPGGALLIADFGGSEKLPGLFRAVLNRWLALFSVYPRLDMEQLLQDMAARRGMRLTFERLYGGYAVRAMLRRPYGH